MPFCNNCGNEVGTSQFCPNCGKPQGKIEPYSGNFSNQVPQNNINTPNYVGPKKKPIGLTLLVIYEILLGVIIILWGIYFASYVNTMPLLVALFAIVLVICVLWGFSGILAGFLMNRWDNLGYSLSYFFLISTGILLFFNIFPLIAMIAFIYYFKKNSNFKNAFNTMRH